MTVIDVSTEEKLEKLAGTKSPCSCDCHTDPEWYYTGCCQERHRDNNIEGIVPAFPMLRVECQSNWHDHPHKGENTGCTYPEACKYHRETCPGWRAKTLDEARLCLEELIEVVGDLVGYEPYSISWDGPGYDSEFWDFEAYALGIAEMYNPPNVKYLQGQGDTLIEAIIDALYNIYKEERMNHD